MAAETPIIIITTFDEAAQHFAEQPGSEQTSAGLMAQVLELALHGRKSDVRIVFPFSFRQVANIEELGVKADRNA
jgi:hypothetical protein